MTVATPLLVRRLLVDGMDGALYYVTALPVGAIVCIAAERRIDPQDLKTGFLIGFPPRAQQIAILSGAFASASSSDRSAPAQRRRHRLRAKAVDARGGRQSNPRARRATSIPSSPGCEPSDEARNTRPAKDCRQGRREGYLVWHKTDDVDGPPGTLVDDAGAAVYFVTPA